MAASTQGGDGGTQRRELREALEKGRQGGQPQGPVLEQGWPVKRTASATQSCDQTELREPGLGMRKCRLEPFLLQRAFQMHHPQGQESATTGFDVINCG